MIKTWIKYFGVAALAFGAGALAWDWWAWPTQNVYVCERLEGDGLFHTTYAYVPAEHALIESWYTNRTPILSYGRYLFDEYRIEKPQQGELYRAVAVRTEDLISHPVTVYSQYVVRGGRDIDGVELEQRTWYASSSPEELEALRNYTDGFRVAGRDYSYAESVDASLPSVRKCFGQVSRVRGGLFS